MNALEYQEGGDHYINMKYQPVQLFIDLEFYADVTLNYFQTNIIKYVSRYKNKNGLEDLKKVLHEVELTKIKPIKKQKIERYSANPLIVRYIDKNNIPILESEIIYAAINSEYDSVKSLCEKLIKEQYGQHD